MNKFFLVAVLFFSVQTFASVVAFRCVTQKGFENNIPRTIAFSLNILSSKNVSIVGPEGRQFLVKPHSDALRALNTYDNGGVYVVNNDRIQISADEIGMYNTQLVLWRKSGFKTGYVATSGESNVKMYSPIVCLVK